MLKRMCRQGETDVSTRWVGVRPNFVLIAKVSLVGGALAWGLDPRCSGRRLFLYCGFKFVLLFWSTVIAQRFGIANMKSNAHLNLQYKTRSKPPS